MTLRKIQGAIFNSLPVRCAGELRLTIHASPALWGMRCVAGRWWFDFEFGPVSVFWAYEKGTWEWSDKWGWCINPLPLRKDK